MIRPDFEHHSDEELWPTTKRTTAEQLDRPTTEDYERLRMYVVHMAGIHDDGCPADDTCNCSGRAINESVNRVCNWHV